MSVAQQFRGQPLVALLAVLAGWMGGRVSTWDGSWPTEAKAIHAAPFHSSGSIGLGSSDGDEPSAGPITPPGAGLYPPGGYWGAGQAGYGVPTGQPYPVFVRVPVRDGAANARVPEGARMLLTGYGLEAGYGPRQQPGFRYASAQFAGLDEEPVARGNERMPTGLPPLSQLGAQPYPPSTVGPNSAAKPPLPRRWSADSWAMYRPDGAGPITNGVFPATYGASQTGAVFRYKFAPRDPRQFTAYMRTTTTLNSAFRQTSGALGLSARPLPSIPVIAAVEGRLTEQGGIRRFQPAAMVVSELPPFSLPGGLRGEAYGQAGYVAGGFATPFADGQFRADRSLFASGGFEARLGGGVWGGVQKGAGRFDAGPSAMLAFPLGRGAFGRLAADWRFRLAGDAEPGSGPAVTLSAGF